VRFLHAIGTAFGMIIVIVGRKCGMRIDLVVGADAQPVTGFGVAATLEPGGIPVRQRPQRPGGATLVSKPAVMRQVGSGVNVTFAS
jgi:hypothetical protein